jgi:hypothetical protein
VLESEVQRVILHQISDKTFELRRLDQAVTMTGDSWSSMATCPLNPNHQTSIVVVGGKVDASELRYKEEGADDEPVSGEAS